MHKPVQTVSVETSTIVRILFLITAFIAGIWLVIHLREELIWIGVAFFLAVALDPAVTWIAKLLRGGRLLATTIVFIIFLAILSLLTASLVPPLVSQTEGLAKQLPHFLQTAQNSHSYIGNLVQRYDLVQRAKQAQSHILNDVASQSGTAVGIVRSIFTGIAATVATLVMTFFMLLEGPSWATLGWRYVPIREQSHYHRIATKMYKIVAGYMTGNLILAALVAVVTALLIEIVGVPYAIPLGILTGLSTLIPVIGGILAAIVICGVALFTSTAAAIILAIYFTIYFFIDGHVLRPIIYGRTIEMSSLLVIVALVLGTSLAGLVGALVAIPVVACFGVVLNEFMGGDEQPHHPKAKA